MINSLLLGTKYSLITCAISQESLIWCMYTHSQHVDFNGANAAIEGLHAKNTVPQIITTVASWTFVRLIFQWQALG